MKLNEHFELIKIILWGPILQQFWKLKFSLYNNLLELAVRFFSLSLFFNNFIELLNIKVRWQNINFFFNFRLKFDKIIKKKIVQQVLIGSLQMGNYDLQNGDGFNQK